MTRRWIPGPQDKLVQHIHAGYWRGGEWTSWPHTFATRRGFKDWARQRERDGVTVVQWRFCGLDDARPARCSTSWAKGKARKAAAA